MSSTLNLAGLDLTKWRKEFIREFTRGSGFEPYMGDDSSSIINVVSDLKTEGYTIRVPLVARLQSQGVTGNQRLAGNEEALDMYYQDITWDFARNAIEVSKKESGRSAMDLLAVRRPLLKEWAAERLKYKLIDCLHQMSDGTNYADAAAATRNTFITNNSDRVLFGSQVSNGSSNVMATALATVDSTNDKLLAAVASIAKRRARLARPIIKPWKSEDGREFYVMFCHPHCFRDLKNDTPIVNANRDARARESGAMKDNPLFQDGDLLYDGIIFKEIPEFYQPKLGSTGVNTNTTLLSVGTGSIDVGVNFLCGQQALGYVQKQMASIISKAEDDYGFFDGLGVEVADGFQKLRWNNGSGTNKDLGIVTVYASAVADS